MTLPRFLVIPTLLLLLGACTVEAGIVSRDLYTPGDGLVTYDDVNQREWLDFSESTKYIAEELLIEIEAGGSLEGFQFAREQDLISFFASGDVPIYDSLPGLGVGGASGVDLIEKLGWTVKATGSILGDLTFSSGLVETDQGEQLGDYRFDGTTLVVYGRVAGEELIPGALNRPINGRNYASAYAYVSDTPFLLGPDNPPVITFWLYRDAVVVPEPATVGFALLACLAVFTHTGRTNRA